MYSLEELEIQTLENKFVASVKKFCETRNDQAKKIDVLRELRVDAEEFNGRLKTSIKTLNDLCDCVHKLQICTDDAIARAEVLSADVSVSVELISKLRILHEEQLNKASPKKVQSPVKIMDFDQKTKMDLLQKQYTAVSKKLDKLHELLENADNLAPVKVSRMSSKQIEESKQFTEVSRNIGEVCMKLAGQLIMLRNQASILQRWPTSDEREKRERRAKLTELRHTQRLADSCTLSVAQRLLLMSEASRDEFRLWTVPVEESALDNSDRAFKLRLNLHSYMTKHVQNPMYKKITPDMLHLEQTFTPASESRRIEDDRLIRAKLQEQATPSSMLTKPRLVSVGTQSPRPVSSKQQIRASGADASSNTAPHFIAATTASASSVSVYASMCPKISVAATSIMTTAAMNSAITTFTTSSTTLAVTPPAIATVTVPFTTLPVTSTSIAPIIVSSAANTSTPSKVAGLSMPSTTSTATSLAIPVVTMSSTSTNAISSAIVPTSVPSMTTDVAITTIAPTTVFSTVSVVTPSVTTTITASSTVAASNKIIFNFNPLASQSTENGTRTSQSQQQATLSPMMVKPISGSTVQQPISTASPASPTVPAFSTAAFPAAMTNTNIANTNDEGMDEDTVNGSTANKISFNFNMTGLGGTSSSATAAPKNPFNMFSGNTTPQKSSLFGSNLTADGASLFGGNSAVTSTFGGNSTAASPSTFGGNSSTSASPPFGAGIKPAGFGQSAFGASAFGAGASFGTGSPFQRANTNTQASSPFTGSSGASPSTGFSAFANKSSGFGQLAINNQQQQNVFSQQSPSVFSGGGVSTTFGGGASNTAFGNSAFQKPAASTNTGSSIFGGATSPAAGGGFSAFANKSSAFGQLAQQPQQTQQSPSLFGGGTSLFGGGSPTTPSSSFAEKSSAFTTMRK